jgi:hypothetical protein
MPACLQVTKLPMSFKAIMTHMCQAGPPGAACSEDIFRVVELGSLDGATGACVGLGWKRANQP